MRPLTMLPSRKSGIAFAITSCICTINKLPPRGVAALSSSAGFFRKANCGNRSATVTKLSRGVKQLSVGRDSVERLISRLRGASPYRSFERPLFLSIMLHDVDLTCVDLRCVTHRRFAPRRIAGRAKSARGDQIARPERGASLGPVVFELSGRTQERRLAQDGERQP